MKSARILKRVQLITLLPVRDAGTDQRIGFVVDITGQGVGVRLRAPLIRGRRYALRIELPTEISGSKTLDVEVRCCWCARADNPDLYDAGLLYEDILPESVEVIEELIARYQQ